MVRMLEETSKYQEMLTLLVIAPVKKAPTAVIISSGKMCMPALAGDSPLTICNRCGRLMTVTMNGKPARNPVLITCQLTRLRKKYEGKYSQYGCTNNAMRNKSSWEDR